MKYKRYDIDDTMRVASDLSIHGIVYVCPTAYGYTVQTRKPIYGTPHYKIFNRVVVKSN